MSLGSDGKSDYTITINDAVVLDDFPSDGIYSIINMMNGIITDKIFSTKKTTHIFGNVAVENEMNINQNYDIVVNPSGSLCMNSGSNINLNYNHSRIIVDGKIKSDGETTININKTGLLEAEENIVDDYYSSHGIVLNNASVDCNIMQINVKNNGYEELTAT